MDELRDIEAWTAVARKGPPSRLRRLAGRLFVTLWAPALLVPGSLLMASHVLTLPEPNAVDPVMVASVARARPAEAAAGFFAVHVLLGRCNCSKRILQHIGARGPRRDLRERVLLVEPTPEGLAMAVDAGFDTESLTREQLGERYHIEAAPLMVVADPAGAIVYVGGYTRRKQSLDVRDTEITSRLLAGERVEPLPLYGCAVAKSLEKQLDPLGIR